MYVYHVWDLWWYIFMYLLKLPVFFGAVRWIILVVPCVIIIIYVQCYS